MTKNDNKIQIRCTSNTCHFHTNYISWPENIPLMDCQICGSKMEPVGAIENASGWLSRIAEDENIWLKEVETKFPAVLAYEYRSLRDYCRKEEPYAVLLSIKDNFEALLKFEVLLAYAWTAKNTSEEFMASTASLLMTPNLTLGAWIGLAAVIARNFKQEHLQLPGIFPLDAIRKKYTDEKIVNWRNVYIGHGAMGMETDEGFRQDIQEKILLLKDIYTSFFSEFKSQRLYLKPDDDSLLELPLVGADYARGLECGGQVYFRSGDISLAFSVDPFLVIRKHQSKGYGIYFFDNQRTRSLTHFLAYADGRRTSESVAYFERLRRQLDERNSNIKPEALADEKNLTPEELHELDMLFMNHGFVKPKHLVNWLKECLDKHEKGIFLLQMNRGTGKSIFTERLSSLVEKPLKVAADIDVRTYHISAMQTAGINYFQSEIEELWRRGYDGKAITRMTSISDMEKDGKTPAEALCDCLNQILEYAIRNRGKSRLLMVLDGLDEIPGDEFWNFIPTESMLNNGIYFLLTSRDPLTEELPEKITNRINALSVTEKYCPKRQENDNVEFLTEYVENCDLKGKIDQHDIQSLISMSDYRVLELGMLCKLAENGMKIVELPNSQKTVSVYLQTLEKSYGEKESIKFRELLAILCTLGSYEGLTLKTISSLISENGITLRLIGMIRDLSPMLKIERGKEGNIYMIANPSLAKELEKQIPETEDTVRWIISLTFSLIDDNNYMDSGIDEVLGHIVELAKDKLPEGINALGDKAEDKLLKVADNYKEIPLFIYRKKEIDIRNQIYILNKECYGLYAPNTLYSKANTAMAMLLGEFSREAVQIYQEIYSKAAGVFAKDISKMMEINAGFALALEASGDYEDSLYFLRKVIKEIKVQNKKDLIDKLIFDAIECRLLYKLHKIDEYLKADKKIRKIIKKEKIESDELTILILGTRIKYLKSVGKLKKAAKANDKLAKAQSNDQIKGLDSDIEDAMDCLQHGDHDGEIYAYEKAYEKVKEKYGPYNINSLLLKITIASTLTEQERFDEAFKILQDLLKIEEEYYAPNHSIVLKTKHEYAETLFIARHYEEAYAMYLEVLDSYKANLGEKHPETIEVKSDFESVSQTVNEIRDTQRNLQLYIERCEKNFGKDHPDTIAAKKRLADFLAEINSLKR